MTELELIIHELSSSNTEVPICGDYSINLLALHGEVHFLDVFELMLGHSFYIKITLSTLNNSSGATLIDNIFCKLSSHTIDTCAGHYPDFFLWIMNIIPTKANYRDTPKWIKQAINNPEAMKTMLNYIKSNDIYSKLNTNILEDQNRNYDVPHEYMKNTKDTFFQSSMLNFIGIGIRKIDGYFMEYYSPSKVGTKCVLNSNDVTRNTEEYHTLKNNIPC